MTQDELEKVEAGVPRFVPVYRLKRVPNWARKHGCKVGDIADNANFNCCAIQPSYYEFLTYKQVGGVRV